ncbi:peptidase domain-containing ABC transporter [Sphingobacterium sp.]|jgi:ATP-binding cassette subfamily B protein|uniref:peptidase domain-containing ABC transporter n=1 Tax=Sphingobacterium sp. TaxID=341027 RepID=UPI0028A1E6BD|nr:peptidase domain-containing ABC transporter [Sphingobacterium sp.]
MGKKIKVVRQLNENDCGRACLKAICLYYGIDKTNEINKRLSLTQEGVSLFELAKSAENLGFLTKSLGIEPSELSKINLPCILHWDSNHFVVLYKIKGRHYYIADPAIGKYSCNMEEFEKGFLAGNLDKGHILLLLPTPGLFSSPFGKNKQKLVKNILAYLRNFKALFFQIFLGLIVASVIQLLIPFLTQSVIDKGVLTNDLGFIKILLFSQLFLLMGRVCVEYLRSWLLLHISVKLNIYILSDFLSKLFKLPISYFESNTKGDLLQRLDDQKRIEIFFTNQTVSIVFSVLTFIIYSIVITIYDDKIFFVFLGFSILYSLWVFIFLKRRKKLDNERFNLGAELQTGTIELIDGIKDIKIHNVERRKRWEWEDLRADLFNFNVKTLFLNQWQQGGGTFINESKNFVIIFICAKSVIEGNMSLGMLLSLQYILGQLNNPIQQFIAFVQSYQDAKLSLNRLQEIYDLPNEVSSDRKSINLDKEIDSIRFVDVSFQYNSTNVLNGINLNFDKNTTTAIVGESGSGKTTILKLLLGYFLPTNGSIEVNGIDLRSININLWRAKIGVVFQDSFLFDGTLIDNVSLAEEDIDFKRFQYAIEVACLKELVKSSTERENMVIKKNGSNLSQGQRQRVLIARAVYKNADIILLDEATSSLDANNEKNILINLKEAFKDKIVIVVAHRLSTVKKSDMIYVVKSGEIVEGGTHDELFAKGGSYNQLIKNQLTNE